MYDIGAMPIDLNVLRHQGKELTGLYMYYYAQCFADDLGGLSRLPFSSWHARVKSIPYASDDELFPENPSQIVEVVARPGLLMAGGPFRALDCKKKSILVGAWAAANKKPYAFIASSEVPSKKIHHVFPVVDLGDGWVTADATFPEFQIGQSYPITYAEELRR